MKTACWGENVHDLSIALVLLFLLRHGSPPHDEKLGAEETNALGPVVTSARGLVREVDVRAKGDRLTVERHRIELGELGQSLLPGPDPSLPL